MRLRWAGLFPVVLLASFARAETIYDSFGTNNSYNLSAGISVFYNGESLQDAAASFSVSTTTRLASATFAIVGDPVDLFLTADDGGYPSLTTYLDAFSVTPSMVAGSTVTISLADVLPAGTYWFLATPSSATSSSAWYNSPDNSSVPASYSHNQNGWNSEDTLAFSVTAAPAPNPLEGGLVLLVLAGFCVWQAYRQLQTQ